MNSNCSEDSPLLESFVEQENESSIPNEEVTSLEDHIKPGYSAIRDAVISANSLPEGSERKSYLKHEEFKQIMKKEQTKILDVMQMVVSLLGKGMKIRECTNEDKAELVVDLNDALLDRSTLHMDVLEGIRAPESVAGSVPGFRGGGWRARAQQQTRGTNQNKSGMSSPSTPTLHTSKVNTRPQLHFKDKIDNSNNPWEPRIKEKPNAMKPLAILVESNDDGESCYSHPYEFELDRWSPKEERLKPQKITEPWPIEETPFVLVENEEQLAAMMEELKTETEMAVDLEHHSYRSFMGFTCLLQISTSEKDYVIDTLSLRNELHVLNEIFTKPTVLKVFHGAENDIDWLQRDLSLYVVNMFDTHQAAKLLDFPKLNLAYLLAHYCGIDANKHFQLYDWRTRPLSKDALRYAREDTHYLLYIYKMMNNELIKKGQGNTNLLESVYQRSTEVCKRRYMKPILDDDSHMLLYRKGKRMFDNRQLYALKELYRWRDRTARSLDESIGYILPTHMMMQIAETLPREVQGILACCNPIPPVLRQSLHEIHYILLAAREQPLVKEIRDSGSVATSQRRSHNVGTKWDTSEPLRDDLPTLLGSGLPQPPPVPLIEPQIPLFVEEEDDQENSKRIMMRLLEVENRKFLNPYQRYKLVLPYVNQMEIEQKEKEEREFEEQRKREKQAEMERNEAFLKQEVIKLDSPSTIPLSKQPGVGNKRKFLENGTETSPLSVTKKKEGGGKLKEEKKVTGKEECTTKETTNTPVKEEPVKQAVKEEGKKGQTKGKGKKLDTKDVSKKGGFKEEGKKSPGASGKKEWAQRKFPEKRAAVINLELNTTEGRESRRSEFQNRPQQQGSYNQNNQPFVPYNYGQVDFNKFHSGADRIPLENQFNKKKVKRKQQFGGKNFANFNKKRR